MRCPKCYIYKKKDETTNKYSQMKIVYNSNSKKQRDILEFNCPVCGYNVPNLQKT